jgi:hypothetical protein
MIDALEGTHNLGINLFYNLGYIHRDVKPVKINLK